HGGDFYRPEWMFLEEAHIAGGARIVADHRHAPSLARSRALHAAHQEGSGGELAADEREGAQGDGDLDEEAAYILALSEVHRAQHDKAGGDLGLDDRDGDRAGRFVVLGLVKADASK